jgi:hypothetical protein
MENNLYDRIINKDESPLHTIRFSAYCQIKEFRGFKIDIIAFNNHYFCFLNSKYDHAFYGLSSNYEDILKQHLTRFNLHKHLHKESVDRLDQTIISIFLTLKRLRHGGSN